jgi:hypothetical protein
VTITGRHIIGMSWGDLLLVDISFKYVSVLSGVLKFI